MLNINESIRPSADLRNHYSDISRLCKENKEAVVITVNGRGDTVCLGYEHYKQIKAMLELFAILAEAEEDIKAGRVAPMQDSIEDIKKRLKERAAR